MVKPFGSTASKVSDITSPPTVLLVDGGPLGVSISCSGSAKPVGPDVMSFSPSMSVHITFGVDGKEIERVDQFGSGVILNDEVWDEALSQLVFSCGKKLSDRGLNVPPEYSVQLRSELKSARRRTLLASVRAFARHYIRSLPAGEACQVWMEEEAKMVLES